MQELRVKSQQIDPTAYRQRYASEGDAPKQINYPCRIYIDDNVLPSAVYCELDHKLTALVEACKSLNYGVTHRTRGMRTRSTTFGYMPRSPTYQQDSCRVVQMAHDYPQQHAVLCESAKLLSALYERHNPEVFVEHVKQTKIVVDNYKMGDTPFTSGIVNKDNQLPYHNDTGNFAGVWSNMFTFKGDIIGGNLTCPQLGVTFMLRDHSVLMFDGQSIMHGVTPFIKIAPEAYRYTVVYYSLQRMWKCLPPAEEIKRADKSVRELTMLRVEPDADEEGKLRAKSTREALQAVAARARQPRKSKSESNAI